MELQLKVSLVYISLILCIDCRLCAEELPDGSNTLKWTCVCAAAPVGVNGSSPPVSNCSTSCHCTPEVGIGGANGEGWTCSCAPEQVPERSSTLDVGCFTSCNCTSGFSSTSPSARKNVLNKVVVIILLLCVILTVIIFIGSAACYFYSKEICHRQSQTISSDRDTSWNSATNLISHRSASFPAFQVSDFNQVAGCIWRASFMFRKKKQTLLSCIVQFSYIELELATDKFSKDNLIGMGGSSNVYCGQLRDGKLVAVKRLKTVGSSDTTDSEFLTEIELLSRLNHRHVVPLLGYCMECQGKQQFERLLVFEYMPNGSLRDCLDSRKDPLDWETRVRIALGVARGLEYLHEAAAPRILHRDVKSTNILLDDKHTAKITDLGMAKRLLADDLMISCTSSPARMLGTFGYFAPEYAMVGRASLKSDIFSFGVVILELITGRQPLLHKCANNTTTKSDESLVLWAAPRLQSSKLVVSELPDPVLGGGFPEEEMQIMAHVARECLHWDPESRPSMSEVVQILSTIASDKARRRSLTTTTIFSRSSCSLKRTLEEGVRDVGRTEEVGRGAHASCRPSSSPVDRNLYGSCCWENNEDTVAPAGFEDALVLLLRSNPWSTRAPDDEIVVDLTEPRFESFVQENTQA